MTKLTPQPRFVGYFDGLDGPSVRGWAYDIADNKRPVTLHVLIDQQEVGSVKCTIPRPDVQAALDAPLPDLGFEFIIPEVFADSKRHSIAFRFPDRSALVMADGTDPTAQLEEFSFTIKTIYSFQSFVDGFKQGALRGWVQRIDPRTGARLGNCQISVTMNGAKLCQARADRYRGDVAAIVGGDPNCGFEIIIPPARRRAGLLTFSFTVTPDGVELAGSPIVTSIVDDQLEGRLLVISEAIDRLYKELTTLRTQMTDILPTPSFSLGDYDRWARRYFTRLGERVAQERAAQPATLKTPLVSVICPTYKPEMSDFTAAVDSVIAQTYPNWELIIVDDGCKSLEIAERIAQYCKADARIRAVNLKKNVGIAGATNAGIKAAKGEWIAFFDHDDLLVDVAVEVMLRKLQQSDAQVVFSDEDKIDQAGYYLEPNIKPDFNYRYLLGCNYVCHFLMVRADILKKAGPLDSSYDGSQDHDLILRLSEIVPHAQIAHVPEILYHWRKTPNSTAVTVANKGYAIDSGVRAVADHLKRIGKTASVSSIRGLTLYEVKWKNRKRPRVSIIIPFKDQIDITSECVRRLLTLTDYKAFEIILVNNWSITPEAAAFCEAAVADKRVRVLHIEEEFNFSRLNNLATEQSQAEFYFFMNNDLFIEDPDWLSTVIAEALSGDDIGAVGGKFFYPNGTIQHVGVVVGPAGIAAHVHRGLADGEYGYIGRAFLTHEVTAVTAAGMLVRADAFRKVGGFDEVNLKVAYNDVDLCLRLREAGYRIIQCNEFTAVHHESLSRGSDDRPEHEARFFRETRYMHDRWDNSRFFQNDPAYSPHFTVDLQPFNDLVDPG